jgi:hypothetical protein
MVEQYSGLIFLAVSLVVYAIFIILLKKFFPSLFDVSNDNEFWH